MASGNYIKREVDPVTGEIIKRGNRLVTRQLPAIQSGDQLTIGKFSSKEKLTRNPHRYSSQAAKPETVIVYQQKKQLLQKLWGIAAVIVVVCALFLSFLYFINSVNSASNQVYPIQLGGTYQNVSTWTNSKGPLPVKKKVTYSSSTSSYNVLGKPTISASFINQVLAAYNSPAAGTGQALYDLGVKYGIDPAFALAFFLHESTLGKYGMAPRTLSLGNLRCIPNYPCVNGYAGFPSWQQGYEEWYKLIRNLYIAQWGKTTVAQIIPTYAPSSDNNNVQGYIAAVEHAIDTWHSGQIMVS